MEKIGDQVADRPTTVDFSTGARRYTLIKEELDEYKEANESGDVVKVADALGDLLYTVLGLACLHGIDAQPIFDEVHASNMTKTPMPGNTLKKCFKGPEFKQPRIADVLFIQTTNLEEAVAEADAGAHVLEFKATGTNHELLNEVTHPPIAK